MAEKIGRNDPCWCGSGQKYKKCHYGRQKETQLPLPALGRILRRGWQRKECLHPEARAGLCGKIINAHTIQRARVLSRITNDQSRVLTFFQSSREDNNSYPPREVGWRDASTFTGFCSVHDSVFAPLEVHDFVASPEQLFLLGYRAICHELYQKSSSASVQPLIRSMIGKGRSQAEQREIQDMVRAFGDGVISGREWAMTTKCSMDRDLLSADFGRLSSWVAYFDGPLSVVSTGAVTPNFDLQGRELLKLHDLSSEVEPIFFGTVSTSTGGAAVFCWHREHDIPGRFMQSLASCEQQRLPTMIAEFMFAYIENTYFSHDWWNSLTLEQQHIVRLHAANLL